jgi:hypothetical protein
VVAGFTPDSCDRCAAVAAALSPEPDIKETP